MKRLLKELAYCEYNKEVIAYEQWLLKDRPDLQEKLIKMIREEKKKCEKYINKTILLFNL